MKYNSMFDVAFSIEHDHEDPYDVPVKDLIAACRKRLDYLESHPDDAQEAFGHSDTYEVPPPL